jgi:cysteine desulfurase/selenocysteine lyase
MERQGNMDRRQFLKTGVAGLTATSARQLSLPEARDPLRVRADFPITRTRTYLNTAYTGPLSNAAHQAALEYIEDRTSRNAYDLGQLKASALRKRFAALCHVTPEEVALLYATSEGENIVTRGLGFKPGDNVVVDDLHFTTSFVLYRQLERDLGIELRVVPQQLGRIRLQDYDRHVDRKTRLVSIAWVSNQNGYRHDARGLADFVHSRGALLYVDAIQALGTCPANLAAEGIDFLTTGGYKWFFAGFGVAPFFVRLEHLDRLRPDRYGHGQVARELPDHRFDLQRTARKFEYGALALGSVYELDAALAYLETVGIERIEQHGATLADELRDGVAKLGFQILTPAGNRSPILTFSHGRQPHIVRELLQREGIDVTFRAQDSQIRVSVALFNNHDDVQKLVKTLATIS